MFKYTKGKAMGNRKFMVSSRIASLEGGSVVNGQENQADMSIRVCGVAMTDSEGQLDFALNFSTQCARQC